MKFINEFGMSLVEIMIAIGLLGGVSLATMQLMTNAQKSNTDFEKSVDVLSLEKTISVYVLSDHGCTQIVNSDVGSSFQIKQPEHRFNKNTGKSETTYTRVLYEEGSVIGRVRIEKMRVASLTKLNSEEDAGILAIELELITKDKKNRFSSDSKRFIKNIMVPVGLEGNTVSDCKLDKKALYDIISERVCGGVFGNETEGMSCPEAIAFVESRIKESICVDLTGSIDHYSQGSGECRLSTSHANKNCPTGTYVIGFDANGGLRCL